MKPRTLFTKILIGIVALALGVGLTYVWFAYVGVSDAVIPASVLKDLEPTVATPLSADIPPGVLKDLEPATE